MFLKYTDKLFNLKRRYYRANIGNIHKTLICRLIVESILVTSWSVSSSFVNYTQNKQKMFLKGFGDPTNGHGGLNFVYIPLQLQRVNNKILKLRKLKYLSVIKSESRDLRSLNMDYVHDILRKFGTSEEVLAGLER